MSALEPICNDMLLVMYHKFAQSGCISKHAFRLHKVVQLGSQGIWNSAEYIFYPLLMLAATPVFLHSLGARQYGQWMLLITLGSLGGWAGMGMGAATIREVASAHAQGDQHRRSDYVRVALFIVLVGTVVISLLLIAVLILGGSRLFAQMGDRSELIPVIVGAPFLIASDQIDSVFSGALRGAERFGLVARLEMLSKIIIVGGCLVTAIASHRLDLLIGVSVALNFLRVAIKSSAVAILFGINSIFPAWHAKVAASLISFGKWSVIQLIGSAIFSSADRLMVGSLLGADSLAIYSICLQLAQQVQSIPAAFGGFLFPYFTKRSQALDGRHQSRLLLVSTGALSLLAIVIALPIVSNAHTILGLWVGSAVAADSSTLLRLLTLGYCTLALPTAAHYFLYGIGQAKWVAISNLVAGILSLLLNFMLVPWFGALGAAASRFVYGAVIMISFSWKLLR
jgi:O-antigen/teichoic acid export membrane protein